MPLSDSNGKIYLGDGAYATVDHDQQSVVLTTEDGITTTNVVVLGWPELLTFLDWLQVLGIITWEKGSRS